MALKLITAATEYPVTLAEAKLHAKIDTSDDDTLITAFISTATDYAEQRLGRAIMSQTWELSLDAFPAAFLLTQVPVSAITSVKYYDIAGTPQTLSAGQYTLDAADDFSAHRVVPAYGVTWPDTRAQVNAVAVRYVSGYVSAAEVPEPIKTWIKIMVSTMYAQRESEVLERANMLTLGFVDRLLDRYAAGRV